MFSSEIARSGNLVDRTETNDIKNLGHSEKLLLVDDDGPFHHSLSRALERRGHVVLVAETLKEARMVVDAHRPAFAVVDLRLGNQNGFELVGMLCQLRPDVRIVMVTGYGNIASAVTAIKTGAVDYLGKPVDADDVVTALRQTNKAPPPLRESPMSANRVRWEHIQLVFEQCNQNVSETERRLSMHRRTLQRILNKRAPRE
ncbi:MAG: ActR/PrrA/RegA family redox response regulator transcription factor [Geminicoccaceae bacterium]